MESVQVKANTRIDKVAVIAAASKLDAGHVVMASKQNAGNYIAAVGQLVVEEF
ncbi:MAG: hypothetical protein LAO56_12940 [Acidobacteriia bacterium]|nr:hypothetical protein [Terriglobia bacterium]